MIQKTEFYVENELDKGIALENEQGWLVASMVRISDGTIFVVFQKSADEPKVKTQLINE